MHSKYIYGETNYVAVGGISEAPFTVPSKTAGNGSRKPSPYQLRPLSWLPNENFYGPARDGGGEGIRFWLLVLSSLIMSYLQ